MTASLFVFVVDSTYRAEARLVIASLEANADIGFAVRRCRIRWRRRNPNLVQSVRRVVVEADFGREFVLVRRRQLDPDTRLVQLGLAEFNTNLSMCTYYIYIYINIIWLSLNSMVRISP